jgi:hypothetical protein
MALSGALRASQDLTPLLKSPALGPTADLYIPHTRWNHVVAVSGHRDIDP